MAYMLFYTFNLLFKTLDTNVLNGFKLFPTKILLLLFKSRSILSSLIIVCSVFVRINILLIAGAQVTFLCCEFIFPDTSISCIPTTMDYSIGTINNVSELHFPRICWTSILESYDIGATHEPNGAFTGHSGEVCSHTNPAPVNII